MPARDQMETAAELQADYHAARARDYGEADAATYEDRVAQGAQMPITDDRAEPSDVFRFEGETPALALYQVWHKEGEAYTHVADVHAADLQSALVFTLNRKDMPWEDYPNVSALVAGARSTDFGDKIIEPGGKAYLVHDHGFAVGFKEADVLYRQQLDQAAESANHRPQDKEGIER